MKVFRKRNPTLKKKAKELSGLCDIPVCLISYGPDGKVHTWPESRNDVEAIIGKYKNLGPSSNLSVYSKEYQIENSMDEDLDLGSEKKKKKNKNKEEEEEKFEEVLATWEGWLDGQCEEEALASLWGFLKSKSRAVNERIKFLKGREAPEQVKAISVWAKPTSGP